jgi:ferredoxin-NADP reductase
MNQQDHAMNEELTNIKALGGESRDNCQKRMKKHKTEPDTCKQKTKWWDFIIADKSRQTPRITSFVPKAIDKIPEGEKLDPGIHATIQLPNSLVRSYSIISGTPNAFQLGIILDKQGRGGSRYLHAPTSVGDVIEVGAFSEPISIAKALSNHFFIVGGINITIFLPLFGDYCDVHYNFEVHYAVRSADEIPFRDHLDPSKDYIRFYSRSLGQRMNVGDVLGSLT